MDRFGAQNEQTTFYIAPTGKFSVKGKNRSLLLVHTTVICPYV